ADRHAQPAEVHLGNFRMHDETAEQRIHAGEEGAARLAQNLDEAVHVARIGDQPVLGADREVGDEIHHQREDVIEGQRRDHHLLAGAQRISQERFELLGVGDEIAVGEGGALREPRSAPVYCRKRRSSPLSGIGANGSSLPCASASESAITVLSLASTGGAGSSAPMPSPGATLMTCLTAVLPMISASVGEPPLKMTIVSTPASLS